MSEVIERAPVNLAADLWTTAEIAEFFRCSIYHARDRVTHAPGFPAPLRIVGSKRWIAEDVREWALRQARR